MACHLRERMLREGLRGSIEGRTGWVSSRWGFYRAKHALPFARGCLVWSLRSKEEIAHCNSIRVTTSVLEGVCPGVGMYSMREQGFFALSFFTAHPVFVAGWACPRHLKGGQTRPVYCFTILSHSCCPLCSEDIRHLCIFQRKLVFLLWALV